MVYRQIGSLQVHPVGLGCMNISSGYAAINDADGEKLLSSAVDHGYNFFDTATMYGSGHSEIMVGKALKPVRQNVVIASKCGLDKNGIDGTPETLSAQCNASLEKLGTDVIDLYYLHRVDPNVPIAESVGALQRLVDAGKIRAIGLSEVCSENLQLALAEAPIAALQSEYSLWSRTPEFGVLDICDKNQVAFVPFSPLGRGFLAGSAGELSTLGEKDLRRLIAHPRFEGDNYAANNKQLDQLKEIAKAQNCSPGQLALAWLLAQRNQTMVPIPGTTKIDHMIENAEAANLTLDASMLDALNELINEDTILGNRYNDERMAEADSERDRPSVATA